MARSQLKEHFRSSMEDLEDPVIEPAAIVGGADTADTAIAEISEAGDSVDEVNTDIDDLQEIEAGMEAIRDSLQTAMEHGGLDPIAADFAHLAFGSYSERLGIEAHDVLPALESFGGSTGKQSATQISMEAVADTLKRIWAAIKAAIEKAIRAVMNFFAKIFGGVDKVIRRVDALKKQLADAKDYKLKDKAKVKVPSPNALQVGGKVDIASIMKGMQNLEDANSSIFGGAVQDAVAYFKTVGDEAVRIKDADEEAQAEEALRKMAADGKNVTDKLIKHQGAVFPGDKTFLETKTIEAGENFGESEVTFGSIKGARAFQGETEIEVPTKEQLKKLLDQSADICKHIKDKKSTIEAVTKAQSDAKDKLDKIVSDSDRGRVGKVWTKGKGKLMLRSARKDVMKPISTLASYDFSVIRALLVLVDSSVKQYEKPKEEAAA